MTMYDPECEKLARYFLPSGASDRLKAGLAQAIQDAVEDHLRAEAERLFDAMLAERVKQ